MSNSAGKFSGPAGGGAGSRAAPKVVLPDNWFWKQASLFYSHRPGLMGGADAPLSPEEGADTPIWLALLPEDGPTGGFFRNRKPAAW